jgi:hypothetical protein
VAVNVEKPGHHHPSSRVDLAIRAGGRFARAKHGGDPITIQNQRCPLDIDVRGHNMGVFYPRFHKQESQKIDAPSICHTITADKSLDW